jgi:hypothetical protein
VCGIGIIAANSKGKKTATVVMAIKQWEHTVDLKNQKDPQHEIEEWLALRKEAGRHIDPETAELDWDYGEVMDSYGIDPNLPQNVGVLGVSISLVRPAVTSGFISAICPKRH